MTKGRKFLQVIEGARTVFLREGYAGASVDDIAGEAQVSKATLYSYFPDKESMFREAFCAELTIDSDEPVMAIPADAPAVEGLPLIVRNLSAQMVSEQGVQSYRMWVGESGRFPDLAAAYLKAGHRRRRDDVLAYLELWVGQGELEIDDLELAAEQLMALTAALIRERALFLGAESVSDGKMQRAAAGAANVFLAAYGSRFGGSGDVPGRSGMRRRDARIVPPME